MDQLNQKFARQQEAVTKAANASQKAQERQQVSAARFEESIVKQGNLVEQLQEKWSKVVEAREAEQNLKRIEEALGNAKKQFEESAKAEDRFFHKLNKSPTQEGLAKFRELQAETKRTQSDIKALEQEASRLREVMMQAPKPELTQKLQDDLDRATSKLERLRNESQISGDELQRNADLAARHFERLTHELGDTSEEIRRVSEEAEELPDAINRTHSPAQTLLSILKGIAKIPLAAGKAFGALSRVILNVGRSLFKTTKTTNGLTGSIGNLHKRLLRLAAAALVFNQIRKGLRSLSDYLGNVMRLNTQFVNSLASVKGNLLTAFQPIYEAILPALNALATALARVTAYLAAFVNFLFGKSAKSSQDAAKGLYDQAKALGATGKAAKDAAGKLAAFDEINVLATENAEDAAGAGGEVVAPDFDYDLSLFEDFFNQFESWPEAFYALGKKIAEAIANTLSAIDWTDVKEKARTIAASIAEFINGFIDTPEFWYQVGRTLAEGINTAFVFLEEFSDTIKWQELGEMIAYGLSSFIDHLNPDEIAPGIYKFVNGIFTTAYAALTETPWGDLGKKISDILNQLINNIQWGAIGKTFGAFFASSINFLYPAISDFNWSGLGKGLGDAISGLFNEIPWSKAGELVKNGINGVIETISSTLGQVSWGDIGTGIATFLNKSIVDADWGAVGSTLGELFNALLDTLYPIVNDFDWDGLGREFSSLINGFIEDTDWPKAGNTLSDSVKGLLESIGTAMADFDWGGLGTALVDLLLGIDWVGISNSIADILYFRTVIQRLIEDMKTYWAEMFEEAGGDIIQGLWNGLLEGFGDVGAWLKEHIVDPFINWFKTHFGIASPSKVMSELGVFLIQGLAQGIQNTIQSVIQIFTDLWGSIQALTSQAWENIKSVWDVVSGWFDETVIQPLSAFFTSFWETVTDLASNAWDNIQGVWSVVADWFNSTIVEPIANFFGSLWEGIKGGASLLADFMRDQVIAPIVDLFRGLYNSLVGIMEGVINGFIGAINGFISGINNVIEKINDIPGVRLSTITPLQSVSIPRLATGAVIPPNSEFLAVLGDQKHGTNIEAPLDTIVEAVMTALENAEIGGGDVNVNINFTGDLAGLARVLNPVIQAEQRRGGVNLIAGGAY